MTDTTEQVAAPAAPEQETLAPEVQATEQADAAPAAPSDDSAPSQEDHGNDQADGDKPKKKGGGFQNRIDQLTREKHELALRAELAERKASEALKQVQVDLTADPGQRPTLDQFQSIEEYDRAVDIWAQRKGYQTAREEVQQQTKQQEQLSIQAALRTREEAAAQKFGDYYQTVNPVAAVISQTPALAEFCKHSDTGPEVAYHLAKNPEVLHSIRTMHPVNALRELTKLEARLAAPPPPKPVTKAPDPIKPVGARETVAKTTADLAQSDDVSAYIARMNKARKT